MISAYNGSEPYIFVSYAHKDSAEVYKTIEKLSALGYRIWYDEGIKPGVEWPENIAVHLDQCALFMMFISPNSMDSANCRREINFALSRSKQFLCIVLEKTEIPLGMELQLASQQSIFRYKYVSEKAYIYKICSAAGMSQCKDTHYFDGDTQSGIPSDGAGRKVQAANGRKVQAAVSDRSRKRTSSPPAKRDRAKNAGRKKGNGGAIIFGVILGSVIIVIFVLFMLNSMGGKNGGDNTVTPTPTVTLTPTPTVSLTPTPTLTVTPVPTEISTQEADESDTEYDTGNQDTDTGEGTADAGTDTGTDEGADAEVPDTAETDDEDLTDLYDEAAGDDTVGDAYTSDNQ